MLNDKSAILQIELQNIIEVISLGYPKAAFKMLYQKPEIIELFIEAIGSLKDDDFFCKDHNKNKQLIRQDAVIDCEDCLQEYLTQKFGGCHVN